MPSQKLLFCKSATLNTVRVTMYSNDKASRQSDDTAFHEWSSATRKASFPGSEMSLRPELANRVHMFARVGS